MKRPKVRIGTLMLVVVIAALAIALIVERRETARRDVVSQKEVARLQAELLLEVGRVAMARTQVILAKDDLVAASKKHKTELMDLRAQLEQAQSIAKSFRSRSDEPATSR